MVRSKSTLAPWISLPAWRLNSAVMVNTSSVSCVSWIGFSKLVFFKVGLFFNSANVPLKATPLFVLIVNFRFLLNDSSAALTSSTPLIEWILIAAFLTMAFTEPTFLVMNCLVSVFFPGYQYPSTLLPVVFENPINNGEGFHKKGRFSTYPSQSYSPHLKPLNRNRNRWFHRNRNWIMLRQGQQPSISSSRTQHLSIKDKAGPW